MIYAEFLTKDRIIFKVFFLDIIKYKKFVEYTKLEGRIL